MTTSAAVQPCQCRVQSNVASTSMGSITARSASDKCSACCAGSGLMTSDTYRRPRVVC